MSPHYRKAIELICSERNINVDVVLSECRFAEIVKCRGLIILIMREIYNLSFRQIGELLKRNTSTIIRMYHKLDEELLNDKELYKDYCLMYNILKQRGLL